MAEVKDALLETMEKGGDKRAFKEKIDELFARRGYDPLNPWRIETIYRTNMQTAYQNGRYMQLTKPHILQARPYWRYLAVMDGSTRPSHAEMHGKIYRHDNPVWQVWYPPNGFNCRCTVVSVSEREIQRNGWSAETDDPTGKPFEVLNERTGELEKQTLLPDTGWGQTERTLQKMLDGQESKEGRVAWREKPGQPGPKELGRPLKGEIPSDTWKTGIAPMERLEDLMSARHIDRAEALGEIEKTYKKLMGITPGESFGAVRSLDGEALTVTVQALAHAMVKRQDARERFIPYLRHVLEDPFEILLSEYETADGRTRYRKKYIGLYHTGRDEAVLITAEIDQQGAVMWNIMNTRRKDLDRKRYGVRVLYGK